MGINVSWLDETKQVIVRDFAGKWTWAEFYIAQEQVNVMLRSVDYTVHQMFDFSASASLPPNTLTHLRNSGRNMPPNSGKSVVITHNEFYLQMYRVLNLVFPNVTRKVVLAGTRADALAKLRTVETG